MGRRPIGERAMTAAEKQRRYRERHSQPKPAQVDGEVERLRAENADLRAKLAGALERKPAVDDGEVEHLKARIAELEVKLARKPADHAEVEQLKARIKALEAYEIAVLKGEARLAFKRYEPAKPKAEKPPLPPDEVRDRRIKALTTEVRNLKAQLRASAQHYAEAIEKAGGMPRETRIAIDKCLHPDGNASEADKGAAIRGWNAWKNTNDKAKRKAVS